MVPQNSTASPATPAVAPSTVTHPAQAELDPRKQCVIDYYAVQGLMTDEEGNVKKMTVIELASLLKVDRGTIYDWRDSIPNFWDRVAKARKRIGGQNRVQKVWNGVFLQAAKGKPEQAKLFLANFDEEFRMPNEKVEKNTANTLIDLMNAARALQQEQNRNTQSQAPLQHAPMPGPVIDGEVVPQ